MDYTNVMVDLETWGTSPGCAIMSIGAVAFDADVDELGPEFHVIVDKKSCELVGLKIDPGTVDWWDRQSIEAKKTMYASQSDGGVFIETALSYFDAYLGQFRNVAVWGNGSDFDNAILIAAFNAIGSSPRNWKYWNNRCFRTLKALAPKMSVDCRGTHHNALDDAKTQAYGAIKMMRALRAPGS